MLALVFWDHTDPMTMVRSWNAIPDERYVGMVPWAWVEFDSSDPRGPFPFLGGVAPWVAASLHQVHQHLAGALDMAISDVFAGRAPTHDPALRRKLENAYAEVVHARPHLREHIRCGRDAEGTFHWAYPLDPAASAVVEYSTLRFCNTITRVSRPLRMDRHLAPAVGRWLGCLDGSRSAGELRAELQGLGKAYGMGFAKYMTELMDTLLAHECLAVTPQASVRDAWLQATRDRDVVHLGHAALLYRQQETFFYVDPWLIPWFAESPVPSLWPSVLPRPAAIFLTHEHDDHVDPRTLLAFPKETPVIVPSRQNRRALYYDYRALLGGLGFTRVIELAHWESWSFDGGCVVAVPFYGECSCDLGMPRNTYLIADRGLNIYIPVDSGPTNIGDNAVKDGVIEEMVRRYGPVDTVYAQPGQLLELRTFAAYACLSHPGRWLEVGENCCVSSNYLAELAQTARARLLVTYAAGGAEWLPDHPVFTLHGRNQALRELITTYWWPLEELAEKLATIGCRCHNSRALDIMRAGRDGGRTEPLISAAPDPLTIYRLDHADPPFGSRAAQGNKASSMDT